MVIEFRDQGSNASDFLKDARMSIAFVSSVVAVTITTIYCLARIGFDNPLELPVNTLSIALVTLLSPVVVGSLSRKTQPLVVRFIIGSDSIIIAVTISILVMLSYAPFVETVHRLYLVPVLSTLTTLLAVREFLIHRFFPPRLIIIGVLFGIFLASAIWGITPHGVSYLNPLFRERLLLGETNRDTVWHVTIANMLNLHGVSSTGLHGIPYFSYHYGSHWLLGRLSILVDASVLDFYQVAPAVVFASALLYMLMEFSSRFRLLFSIQDISQISLSRSVVWWFVAACVLVGVVPYSTQISVGFLWDRYVHSESFMVSIILLFMFLSFITYSLTFGSTWNLFHRGTTTPRKTHWILLLIPISIIVFGFIKLSLMVVTIPTLVFGFFRLKLWLQPLAWIAAALVIAAFLFTISKVHYGYQGSSDLQLFAYIRTYVGPFAMPIWLIVTYFNVLFYLATRLITHDFKTLGDIYRSWKSKQLLDLEILAVVTVIGTIPSLILSLPGWTIGNFTDIQYWLAGGMLVGYLPLLAVGREKREADRYSIRQIAETPVKSIGISFLLAFAAFCVTSNFAWQVVNSVTVHFNTRLQFSSTPVTLQEFIPQAIQSLRDGTSESLVNLFTDNYLFVERSPRHGLLQTLEEVGSWPDEERRETLLWIPKSAQTYWDWHQTCTIVPFISPAITGLAQFDGLPSSDCLTEAYGFSIYRGVPSPSLGVLSLNNASELQQVCDEVRRVRFAQLAVLSADPEGSYRITRVRCDQVESSL